MSQSDPQQPTTAELLARVERLRQKSQSRGYTAPPEPALSPASCGVCTNGVTGDGEWCDCYLGRARRRDSDDPAF